ncbi:thioesterase II family protein [Streptomyces sp. IBSBF 2435]|uniref:thioesterase II family protein n=1 Tax=Streptomyces sp. IBSBF 2435 TaxID=2903531 RepID=UPI002FDBA5B4
MTAVPPRWLVRRCARPSARLRLYCFPHSGGLPGEYLSWFEALADVECWGVQSPGRGSRIAETPLRDVHRMVEEFLGVFAPPQEPYAFFGHSLGALVAFETARALRDRGAPQPRFLLLSSCPPPAAPRDGRHLADLDDAGLLALTEERYGPLPADPALLALVMPLYRADLAAYETYRYRPGPPLGLPVRVVGGDQDTTGDVLAGWGRETTGPFGVSLLPGGHFYLRGRPQRRELLRITGELLHD